MAENTEEQFSFTIEEEPFVIGEQKPMAKTLLKLAREKGIEPAQDQIEKLVLKGASAVYKGDDVVDLLQDKAFEIGLTAYEFKVNGVEIHSPLQKIVALDVLQLAKNKGAFPGKPEDYILEGDKGQYKPNDWVDLVQDKMFITAPNKPTTVA